MLDFNITISSSNAAVASEDDARAETARLLRLAAERIECGQQPGVMRDSNGNCVGRASFSFYPEDD